MSRAFNRYDLFGTDTESDSDSESDSEVTIPLRKFNNIMETRRLCGSVFDDQDHQRGIGEACIKDVSEKLFTFKIYIQKERYELWFKKAKAIKENKRTFSLLQQSSPYDPVLMMLGLNIVFEGAKASEREIAFAADLVRGMFDGLSQRIQRIHILLDGYEISETLFDLPVSKMIHKSHKDYEEPGTYKNVILHSSVENKLTINDQHAIKQVNSNEVAFTHEDGKKLIYAFDAAMRNVIAPKITETLNAYTIIPDEVNRSPDFANAHFSIYKNIPFPKARNLTKAFTDTLQNIVSNNMSNDLKVSKNFARVFE